jgi:hypothetical protein
MGVTAMDSEPPAPKIYYPPVQKDNDIIPGRPGCLTLLIIYSLLTPLLELYLVANDIRFGSLTISRSAWDVLDIVRNLLLLVSLIGLWRMKNWGRRLAILTVGITIIASVILFAFFILEKPADLVVPTTLLCGQILRFITHIIALYWLITNRVRFE